MNFTIIASDGTLLPLDSLEQSFTYDGEFVDTITISYVAKTFIQTFVNDGTNITTISQWVVQP